VRRRVEEGTPMFRRLIVVTVSVAVVLLWAVPAQAAATTLMVDGFEASPTNWTLEHAGLASSSMIYNPVFAHSGSGSAFLGGFKTGAFSAVGRMVHLGSTGVICQFTASIDPLSLDLSGHNHLNIEVINPSTWTYVAVGHADFTAEGWQVGGINWIQSLSDVYIRVSELGDDNAFMYAEVDDARVSCNNFL
jgi:hypothetical protein